MGGLRWRRSLIFLAVPFLNFPVGVCVCVCERGVASRTSRSTIRLRDGAHDRHCNYLKTTVSLTKPQRWHVYP
jgi:hypothetical protein